MNEQDLDICFSGKKLYGDDFSLKQIKHWYTQEAEAYYDLSSDQPNTRQYAYHELNQQAGFNHLPDRDFNHALGLGSAYGDEFRPIEKRLKRVTILESSEGFRSDRRGRIAAEYIAPESSGDLPFHDATFDYAQSLGVLHHIPNVSHVISEISRCLIPGGFFLLREPIVSMGDWRHRRKGLTINERGIPLDLLVTMVENSGFKVASSRRCLFPVLPMLIKTPYKYSLPTKFDLIICHFLRKNQIYHPKTFLEKLQPTSIFMVLQKQLNPLSDK